MGSAVQLATMKVDLGSRNSIAHRLPYTPCEAQHVCRPVRGALGTRQTPPGPPASYGQPYRVRKARVVVQIPSRFLRASCAAWRSTAPWGGHWRNPLSCSSSPGWAGPAPPHPAYGAAALKAARSADQARASAAAGGLGEDSQPLGVGVGESTGLHLPTPAALDSGGVHPGLGA